MEVLLSLLSFINKVFIPISAYFAGKTSKENESLKKENEKLKEYKKIDDKEIQVNEVYNEKAWL